MVVGFWCGSFWGVCGFLFFGFGLFFGCCLFVVWMFWGSCVCWFEVVVGVGHVEVGRLWGKSCEFLGFMLAALPSFCSG